MMLIGCKRAGPLLGILWMALGAASAAMAQAPPPPSAAAAGQFLQGPVAGLAVPDFVYLSAGPMWEEKTVIDAPYSAEAVSESRQTLTDGNVIDHKESSTIYRDSAGRVRRETNGMGMLGMGGDVGFRALSFSQTSGKGGQRAGIMTMQGDAGAVEVTAAGPVMGGESVSAQGGPSGKTLSTTGAETMDVMGGAGGKRVTLYDPLAHVTFLLDPARKVAYKMTRPPRAMVRFRTFVRGSVSRHEPNETSQSLGTRTFDGVTAYGTRTTTVIPAGAIGNEKPITVVSDRWYSPKLQTNVMTRRDDPRFGVITYQLTNIKLGEPPEALFKVPSDYAIKPFPPKPRGLERRHPKNG